MSQVTPVNEVAPARRTVVISQPMLFPWVGLLEQTRLADVFVHYDDVAFSKGSFSNRVQIKTSQGSAWLTVPIHVTPGQHIKDVRIDVRGDFRKKHLTTLAQAYARAPHRDTMLELVRDVYRSDTVWLCEVTMASWEALSKVFGVRPAKVLRSSETPVGGAGHQRVLDLVRHLGGTRYVSGHGGRNYLEHEAFERAGVSVEYLDYRKVPYPQRFGEFTPFVSALDLLANVGPEGASCICSGTLPWRRFMLQ